MDARLKSLVPTQKAIELNSRVMNTCRIWTGC